MGTSSNQQNITTSYKTVGTLPEQYRPSRQIRFVGDAMGGTQQVFGHIIPSSGGEPGAVKMYATASTTYWDYTVTYPAE